MFAQGIEYGVGDLLREKAMHHLVFAVVTHLGHHRLVTFDTVGDAVGEVQLVVIAEVGTVEIVEPDDDFGQALLLGNWSTFPVLQLELLINMIISRGLIIRASPQYRNWINTLRY